MHEIHALLHGIHAISCNLLYFHAISCDFHEYRNTIKTETQQQSCAEKVQTMHIVMFFLIRIFHSKTCTNGVNWHILDAGALYCRPSVVFSTEMDAGSISNDDRTWGCGKRLRIHEVTSNSVECVGPEQKKVVFFKNHDFVNRKFNSKFQAF